MNAASEGLLGRSRGEVIGRMLAWDIAPGGDLIWEDILAGAREHGRFHGAIAIATPAEPRQLFYAVRMFEEAGEQYAIFFGLVANISEAEAVERLDDAIDTLFPTG